MILSGKELARDIRKQLKKEVSDMKDPLHLAIILVGDDPASQVYVGTKQRACEKMGIQCTLHTFDTTTPSQEIEDKINELNNDKNTTGILLQSPVPSGLDFLSLANLIDPSKDVDGVTKTNVGKIYQGDLSGIIPGTPKGVMKLLEHHDKQVRGRHVVMIGRSMIVGRPLGMLILHAGGTLTWCHSQTTDLAAHTRTADIIISAVGQKNLLTLEMVREKTTIIDVGINRDGVEGLVGDTDFESLKDVCDISPVPGGVGPMTIACLLENVVLAYKLQSMNNEQRIMNS